MHQCCGNPPADLMPFNSKEKICKNSKVEMKFFNEYMMNVQQDIKKNNTINFQNPLKVNSMEKGAVNQLNLVYLCFIFNLLIDSALSTAISPRKIWFSFYRILNYHYIKKKYRQLLQKIISPRMLSKFLLKTNLQPSGELLLNKLTMIASPWFLVS